MSAYIWKVSAALSQLLNALIGGDPNLTLSSRAFINRRRCRYPYLLFNTLFFWQKDHCQQSWEDDVRFAHHVIALLSVEEHEEIK